MSTIQSTSSVSFQGRMLDKGSVVYPTKKAVRYVANLGEGAVDGLTKFLADNTVTKNIEHEGGFLKRVWRQFKDPVHAATKAHRVKVVGLGKKERLVVVAGDNRSGYFVQSDPIFVELPNKKTEVTVAKAFQNALQEGMRMVRIKTKAAEIRHPDLKIVG